jgi:phosphatidylinositol glycan class B
VFADAAWSARRPWLAVLGVFLVAGFAARLYAALTDLGVYWPDEVYQSLEPAHGLVYGTALLPWEFIVGARNWLLPGLVAGLFTLTKSLGVSDPHTTLLVVRVAFALVSMGTVLGTLRLGQAIGLSRPAVVVGAAMFSAMNLAIYFSPRAMSEVASALPVVWGLALVLEKGPRWRLIVGASLLGLAVLFRIHCGLFAVTALVTLLVSGRRKDAAVAFGVLCGWALVYGLIDLFTWGRFLHSALLYLQFNVIDGRAADWGVGPPAYYTKHLLRSLGALWVLLAVFALLGIRRAAAVVVPALLFLGAHIAMPHKELRFILPMLPLACVGAGAALDVMATRRRSLALGAAVVLLGASAYSFATHRQLTFHQIGRMGESGSAWDSGGSVTRLLFTAGRQERLCGVGLLGWERMMTFAYTALHRDVPYYPEPLPSPESGFYDLVITPAGHFPGTVIARDGAFELVRLPDRPCVKDPNFQPYLDDRTARLAKDPTAL